MRNIFLALLSDGARHGYELRATLEQNFGAFMPAMNPGQIYTTLQRLERDGLVNGEDVPGDNRNKREYSLTETGRAELARWVDTPVPTARLKDEFFMKLVLVGSKSAAVARRLVDVQRREYLQRLRDLGGARPPDDDVVASLLVEGAQLHVEADLKWLDLCEHRLLPKDR
jgi:DNA-binding PadR family transcriptional regulator